MKKYLFIVLCCLPLVSCDPDVSAGPLPAYRSDGTNTLKSRPGLPGNQENAFDYVGLVHNEILYAYYADTLLPASEAAIVERVDGKAALHPYFEGLTPEAYGLVPASRISGLAAEGGGAMASLMEGLPLSLQARYDFHLFVTAVLAQVHGGEDGAAIHGFVVDYETHVAGAGGYTAGEKEYLLTITSIVRHSLDAKGKKPKKNTDPDWDWLTANIAGAALGAQYGKRHAVLVALKAGIMENR